MENLDAASKEKDSQKQFEALSGNFDILSGLYSSTHDSKIREKAQNLGNFITNVFSDKRGQFNVTCLDSSCWELTYSAEEEEILKLVAEIEFVDSQSKDNFLRSMEAAALATNPEARWHNHDAAFRTVIAQGTEDPKIKELAGKIRDLIKTNYPQIYAEMEERDLYKID